MIAILAHPDDRLAQLTHAELRRQDQEVEFLDASTLMRSAGLSWSLAPAAEFVDPEGFLDLGASVLELRELRSVLARQTPLIVDPGAHAEEPYAEAEAQAALLALLTGLPGLVVNVPRPLDVHRLILSRPQPVIECGLKLAPTLVTTEAQAAERFFAETCREQALVGTPTPRDPQPPDAAQAPITLSGPDGAAEIRARAEQGPVVIQAVPEGARMTVVVVGEHALAGAPDGEDALHPAEVEADVQAQCVTVAQRLGLSLAGIDLVVHGTAATCLEVAGIPQADGWTADLEEAVVSALCALLVRGSRS